MLQMSAGQPIDEIKLATLGLTVSHISRHTAQCMGIGLSVFRGISTQQSPEAPKPASFDSKSPSDCNMIGTSRLEKPKSVFEWRS
jgi:hypothetical protein